nr:retinal rod rhodopsin-sensitive cGMP 3',5'-cyclic phosphodiesterase subunit gamma isoform X1 [Vicugna pacos]
MPRRQLAEGSLSHTCGPRDLPQYLVWGRHPGNGRPGNRHHCHLPVGSLQSPGAARAGPVRDHLALDPDLGPYPPLPAPTDSCFLQRGLPPRASSVQMTLCLETLAGRWLQAPGAHPLHTGCPLGVARPCLAPRTFSPSGKGK